MRMRGAVVLLMAMHAAAVADETMYKWVDETGVTHYSKTSPPGKNRQELRISPSPALTAAEREQHAKLKQARDDELQRRRQEEKRVDAENEARKRDDEVRRRYQCDVVRAELARLMATKPALKNRPTTSLWDPGTGKEVELMNNADRSLRIEAAESGVRKWCGTPERG
jgi:hypothetical protein